MVAKCPYCVRTNPLDARFCYFDGAPLDGDTRADADAGSRTRLPSSVWPTRRLEVQPRSINLGVRRVGASGQVVLRLQSTGDGVTFGAISSDSKWLAVSDTGDARSFQFRQSAQLAVKIKGQHLLAGMKPREGRLRIMTNAGNVQVRVRIHVPIQPYPDGIFAGARTPRDLAEIARRCARYAAPLLECGAVARWFRTNGWTYPVQGPTAKGLAAVQQFFEALGVSKPPPIRIRESNVMLTGPPGARLRYRIQLRAQENRPIYAHGESDVPWLVVKPALLAATAAELPLEVFVPEQAGLTIWTTLRIQANGRQMFEVPVEVSADDGVARTTLAQPCDSDLFALDSLIPRGNNEEWTGTALVVG